MEVMINFKNRRLLYDLIPYEANVMGATGVKAGAVIAMGKVSFMGTEITAYLCDLNISVLAVGVLCGRYGFRMGYDEYFCRIINTNNGNVINIRRSGDNLYTVREIFFERDEHLPSWRQESLPDIRQQRSVSLCESPGKFAAAYATTEIEDYEESEPPSLRHSTLITSPMKIGRARKQRALAGRSENAFTILHDRLGHIHLRKIKFMLGKSCYRERGLDMDRKSLESERKLLNGCKTCMQAKGHKVNPSRELIFDENTLHGTVWHVDLTGRKDTPSTDGHYYGVVFVERKTRLSVCYTVPSNGENDILKVSRDWVIHHINIWKGRYSRTHHNGLWFYLHADNLEFQYSNVIIELKREGVIILYSPKSQSARNGLAERTIGVIGEIERSLRIHKNLPDQFWGPAFLYAGNTIRNIVPFSLHGRYQVDPYQAYYNRVFDYTVLRTFGAFCTVLLSSIRKTRSQRSVLAIYIGFAQNSISYLCYIPELGTSESSPHVIFDEARENPLEVEPQSSSFLPLTAGGSTVSTEYSQAPPATSETPQPLEKSAPLTINLGELPDEEWASLAMKNFQEGSEHP